MGVLFFALAISHVIPAQAMPANACSNGSFEDLSPSGLPVDWGPLGRVESSADAYSGRRSLRLLRTSELPTVDPGER